MKNNTSSRDSEKLKVNVINSSNEIKILLSPSDQGVRRNLGRAGSRFSPDVITKNFLNLNRTSQIGEISLHKVWPDLTTRDFEEDQIKSSKLISKNIITLPKKLIHIGGGHDHALPFLMALDNHSSIENIIIINIDAHLDTRVDDIRHSGTPFRDFDILAQKKFYLLQYGIQEFANDKHTQTPLKNNWMKTLLMNDIILDKRVHNTDIRKELSSIIDDYNLSKEKTHLFISLDCDALNSSYMSAVSAVNHNGFDLEHILNLIKSLRTHFSNTSLGVYEYNPLYDNISSSGARALCSIIWEYIK